jgi:HK97 family phage major capsid protein
MCTQPGRFQAAFVIFETRKHTMSAHIRALKAKKADALKAAGALNAITDRQLSAEEQTTLDGHIANITGLNAQIERAEFLANQEAGLNASGGVTLPANATITVTENVANDPKRGYKSFNEFAGDLVKAGRTGDTPQRLRIGAAAPGTFGGEGVGADGGFLVPPAFSSDIFTLALTDDALLPKTDSTPVGGNGMVFPKDETTPWGTNGVRAYWQAEATAATATKPVLGTQAMRLHKLMALVPLTNELVDDSVAGGAFVMPLVARSIRWKTNEAILFGTGDGQPQGMFISGAVQVVSKDSGQAANTLTVTNVANMIAQLPPGTFGDAEWLITPDALPSLFTMTLGNYPIYLPASAGAQGNPYGSLMGRPINVSQHVGAFSTKGDLSLIVPNWYRTITKAGGAVQADQSMHLYFDADVTAFRATFRMDGGSKIAAGITQAKGSKTLSPFLQLQAR